MNKQGKSLSGRRKVQIITAVCASLYAFGAYSMKANAAETTDDAATDGAATWEQLNAEYPKSFVREALKQHYVSENYPEPMLWHRDGELTPRGSEALNSLLLAELRGTSQQGLNKFSQRVRDGRQTPAAADWLITARLLQLNHRLEGIDPTRFNSVDARNLQKIDADKALRDIVTTAQPVELLKLWRPNAPGFGRLSDFADEYDKMTPWQRLDGSGVLSVGDKAAEVVKLKQRLASEGFKPEDDFDRDSFSYTNKFSDELAEQLREYQRQRGLETDGLLGPNTRKSLNISPAERALQLRLNLARLKALPADLGEHYVWVNIPEYKARIVKGGETDFETRVVVGKQQHKTPIFIDHMDYIEVNPYWNIPRSIVIDEVAPASVKNPAHVNEKDMEILSSWASDAEVLDPLAIDWQGIASGSEPLTFRVRQRPGDNNALGRVKFIFPNDHNVYLHDTPQDALFERNKRNFSHGCVRLHKPFDMAEYVLAHRRDEPSDFREILDSRQPQRLHLDQPLPVYLVYFSTWVDDDGKLQIRNDVYGHDRKLAAELKQQRDELISNGRFNEVIALEDKLIPYYAIGGKRGKPDVSVQ